MITATMWRNTAQHGDVDAEMFDWGDKKNMGADLAIACIRLGSFSLASIWRASPLL